MKYTLGLAFCFIAFVFLHERALGVGVEGLDGVAIEGWSSSALGSELERHAYLPEGVSEGQVLPTIIYLLNLSAPRVGRDSDASIVSAFLEEGYQVISVDYANATLARQPTLNPDILKVREEVLFGDYLTPHPVDQTALFIVPSGHRVRRDVLYDEGGLKRGLDVIYPTNPAYPAGALMEFSCDNAERMGNYSMFAIRDTLLEGAATEGYAVAMADHPWAFGYSGIDPMPDSARRAKAAVRALRAVGPDLGLSGDIVTMGFSRGSGVALMTATTFETDQFDAYYANQGVDSSVQGNVIFAGRFSYTDLLPDDQDMGTYVAYWGSIEDNYEKYEAHSALSYLESKPPHPFFLSINTGEEADAQNQMEVLRNRLAELEAEFTYSPDTDGVGHKMPIDPEIVAALADYLSGCLKPSPEEAVGQLALQLQAGNGEVELKSVGGLPPLSYSIQRFEAESGWAAPEPVSQGVDGGLSVEVQDNTLYRILVGQPE